MLNLSVIHNLKVSGRQNIFVYAVAQTEIFLRICNLFVYQIFSRSKK